MSAQVTVLYIGGYGRSGSTILAQMLGQVPGFVNVGELWQIWDRGLRENELCSCGQSFYSCGFWNIVGDEAFGGWGNIDADRAFAFKPFLKRQRYIPHYALARTGIYSHTMAELLEEYRPILERLYRATQSVSGARVLVDSSKRPLYAFLLSMLPFVDLRVVHLVRDSRAVAYSWSKDKVRDEIVGRRVLMPRVGPVQASRAWTLQNYSYNLLSGFAPLSRLRYEDFVDDPNVYIGRILASLGFEKEVCDVRFLHGHKFSPIGDHAVSGNPNRLKSGTRELRADEEWKVKMKGADKNVVTALTAPLLFKYGYLGRSKKAT